MRTGLATSLNTPDTDTNESQELGSLLVLFHSLRVVVFDY